jgi:ParB/RepB/Spo0J family partition protein
MSEIVYLDSSLVHAEGNDRKTFDEAALWELAESIRKNDLAQPPTVRRLADDSYGIVAGERRVRAMRLLGWEKIPCIVRALSDEAASAIMLAENVARVDLDPMEEAQSYQRRVDEFGWTVKEIADKAGVSLERVKGRMKLLRLAPRLRDLVSKKLFPIGHAELVATLEIEQQLTALRLYERGATGYETFSQIVMNLRHADDQMSMFALEELVIAKLDALKDAVAAIPTSTHLPAVRKTNSMTGSEVMHGYIQDLLAAGLETEAAAVGNVLDVLVKCNWLRPPRSVSKG